ncbi:MAG: hypothetical protein DVB22_001610, partial [Verrucomicrobia bacterium]
AEPIGLLLDNAVWDNNLLSHVSRRLFDRFIPYVFDRTDPFDRPLVFRRIEGVRNQAHRTSAMTLAQHLRQEGRQEGTLAASRQSVLEALDLRFGPIPDGLRDSLNAIADPEKLRALLRAAIVSDSLEAFAASL